MNKPFRAKLLTVCALLAINLFIGTIAKAQSNNSKGPAVYQTYEQLVRNKLALYIKDRDFIVKVYERFDTTESVEFNSNNRTPSLFDQLPGIPDASLFLKDSFQRDSVFQRIEKLRLPIIQKYLGVELIVSDEYTDEDRRFIKDFIKMVIPIDESRGDRIIIITRKFPALKKNISDSIPTDSSSSKQYHSTTDNPKNETKGQVFNNTNSSTNNYDAKDSTNRSSFDSITSQQPERYILYSILGFSLLFCSIAVVLYFYSLKKNIDKLRPNINAHNDIEEKQPNVSSLSSQGSPQKNTTPNEQIVSYFIKSPKAISAIIERDFVSEGLQAIEKYAKVIIAANKELYLLLEPYLKASTYRLLQNKITALLKSPNSISNNELDDILERFQPLMEREAESIFSFLNRINDKQLFFLLKDEENDVIAVTIAQLKSDRAQNLLSYFNDDKKSDILTELGLIGSNHTSFFKEVATKLNNRIPEFEGMNDLSIDGISGMINILDDLSDREQNILLDKISLKAPQLVAEIRQLFIGFGNIIHIQDSIVEKSIENIETSSLTEAIMGYDQVIQEKIIRLRPTREQEIIRSLLEENRNIPQNGFNIRKKIIISIRNELKNSGRKI